MASLVSADVSALQRARKLMSDAPADAPPLEAAIAELARAEEQCSADEAGMAVGKVISHVKDDYTTLAKLLAAKPADIDAIEKKLAKVQKKMSQAQTENDDDEELVSKAEKAEKKAKLDKARAAVDKATEALTEARAVADLRKPREAALFPRLAAVRPRTGSVQVVSEAPMVVVVDDWLGEAAMAALKELPAVLDKALNPPTDGDAAGGEPPPLLPTNATELGTAADYGIEGSSKPSLCAPAEETARAAFLRLVDDHVARAKAARKGADGTACDATAGLVEEAPADWDTDEDGDWKGEYNEAADRYPNVTGGCGPLTPALEAALVASDSLYVTTSTERAVDIVDIAISAALGLPLDVERMATHLVEGTKERKDESAVQPDTWDAEEDGEWAAPMLPAKGHIELLAELVKEQTEGGKALGDAYSFSSSPELRRFRAAAAGGEKLHFECADFARKQPGGYPSVVAYVHASEPAEGAGGALEVPAAGVSVAPKLGRLVLMETVLPDGTCDPAAALRVSPLAPTGHDLVLLRKSFHADRTFSRERQNHEGPRRLTPTVKCVPATHGCRRFDHIGASSGDAVLPLREATSKRDCAPPAAGGGLNCADKPPPPPPPKKKKKKAAVTPSTPPPEAQTTPPPPPPPPEGPQAPPPVTR